MSYLTELEPSFQALVYAAGRLPLSAMYNTNETTLCILWRIDRAQCLRVCEVSIMESSIARYSVYCIGACKRKLLMQYI